MLELNHETEGISLPSNVYEIGCYYPVKAYRFPAILALKPAELAVEEALCAVAALTEEPFIFLTATSVRLSDRAKALSAHRDILVAALSKSLAVSDNGLCATDEWTTVIQAFHEKLVPKPDPVKVFFPTPPDATWYDVTIQFVDGHTVHITVAGVCGRYSYNDMGMANRRESTPSKQWEFLYKIAENHRIIESDNGSKKRNKSWKYELASDLRAFFRIDDDPFWPYDAVDHCWEAKFQVYPVADR